MPGTVSCRRSKELCKKLGIKPDAPEEEGGDQLFHENDDVVGKVEAPVWSRWMRNGLASTFLARVEYGGEEGFEDAVKATEADSMKIEEWWEAKKASRDKKRVVRKGELLLIDAANDVRKHLHEAGARRHIADVIERVARDEPDQPRLDPASVLKVASIEPVHDENNRILLEMFEELDLQMAA